MFESIGIREVEAQRSALGALVAAFDPGSVPLPDAPVAFRLLDEIERLASGAKILIAERVEASRVWEREGFATAA
ncbi:MAG: hypothetical protein ABIW84_11075, partial [Ilumatobacteraceae bacterium]